MSSTTRVRVDTDSPLTSPPKAEPVRIACGAEPWGFGPVAKLSAIVRSLKMDADTIFVGTGTSARFAVENPDVFAEVVELTGPFDGLWLDVDVDLVLAVMDPWLALWGARKGIPVVYVDSLYWFWTPSPRSSSQLSNDVKGWVEADDDELKHRLSGHVDWHDIVPLAYAWSTAVAVQQLGSESAPALEHVDARFVGAIIAMPSAGDGVWHDSDLVISTSGSVSHVVSSEHAARYLHVLTQALPTDLQERTTLLVNPDLWSHVEAAGWRPGFASRSEMASIWRSASLAAFPAGLTTMLESAGAGLPFVLLPEQHGGHGKNASLFDPYGITPSTQLADVHAIETDDPMAFVEALDAYNRRLLSDPRGEDMALLRSRFASALSIVDDPEALAALRIHQRARAELLCGGFDGARQIADLVHEIVG